MTTRATVYTPDRRGGYRPPVSSARTVAALAVCAATVLATVLLVRSLHAATVRTADRGQAQTLAQRTLTAIIDNGCADDGTAALLHTCQGVLPAAGASLGGFTSALRSTGTVYTVRVDVTVDGPPCPDSAGVIDGQFTRQVDVTVATSGRRLARAGEQLPAGGTALAVPAAAGRNVTVIAYDGTPATVHANKAGCALFLQVRPGPYTTSAGASVTVPDTAHGTEATP